MRALVEKWKCVVTLAQTARGFGAMRSSPSTPRMKVMTPPKLTMETFSPTGLPNLLGGLVEGDELEVSRGNTTEVFDSCIPKTTSSNHSLHAKTVDEGIFATPNTKEKLPKNSGNAPIRGNAGFQFRGI